MATLCPKCRSRYPDTETLCPADGRTLVRDLSGIVLHERYTLRDLIGLGGMGSTVWRAVQSNIGRSVAIKLLPPTTESAGQRFEREAKIASNLNHPHIVTVHDFGQASDGSLFLVMEFLEGRTLHRELRDNAAFPLDRALKVADQTLRALEHAHAANVVHRDLKPGNLFLTKKGDDTNFVKVLDFGLAKYVADSVEGAHDDGAVAVDHDVTGQAHIVCGTPNFMAPEQVLCGRVDGRADVYAMGVVLFRMLTGQTPFGSESNYDLYRKVISQPPPTFAEVAPGHEVPHRLEEIVRKAMAKSPDDRYSSARHMRFALREVRHSLGVLSDDSDDFYSASSVLRLKSAVVAEAASELSKSEIIPVEPEVAAKSPRKAVWYLGLGVLLLAGAAALWFLVDRPGPTAVSTSSPASPSALGSTTVGGVPTVAPTETTVTDPSGGAAVGEVEHAVDPSQTPSADLTGTDEVRGGQPVATAIQPMGAIAEPPVQPGVVPGTQEVAVEPPVVTARLEVTSEPSGAQVTKNGSTIGTTPYTIESEAAVYEWVLVYPGYRDYPVRVELDPGQNPGGLTKHHAVLAKAAPEPPVVTRRKGSLPLGKIERQDAKISGIAPNESTKISAPEKGVAVPTPTGAGEKRFKVVTLDDGVTRDAVVSDKKPPTGVVSTAPAGSKPLQIQVLGAPDNPQPGAPSKQNPPTGSTSNGATPTIRVEPLEP